MIWNHKDGKRNLLNGMGTCKEIGKILLFFIINFMISAIVKLFFIVIFRS